MARPAARGARGNPHQEDLLIHRTLAAALVAAFLMPGPAHGQARQTFTSCGTVREHNQLVRHVLRFSHHGGDYRASRPTEHQLARLGSIRACAKRIDPPKYRLMRGAWSKRRAVWAFHRHIDEITPYGKWALPPYIVWRESRGDRCAQNTSSTAGGYYQFLTSTWQAYGGRGNAACAPDWEQHEVAARAWAGGAGASHWALTA